MPNARVAALRALVALEQGRAERIREVLEGQVLSDRDRPLAFELAHGVLRRERSLDAVLSKFVHRGLPKNPAQRQALRLGAYQLLFCDGIPARAAVDESVRLVRANKGFVNAVLRRLAEGAEGTASWEELLGPLPEDEVERLSIRHSLPPFLVARWLEQHGSEAVERIGRAASAVPSVVLRPTAVGELDALRAALGEAGVRTEPQEGGPFLRWTGGTSPFASVPFAEGRFVVQDPTAWLAADAVPCGPGDTVIDLCAAPGAKTTWLAAKVRPSGRVLAYDVDEERRGRLIENVVRTGLEDTIELVADVEDLPVARAVLVDVPCSNSGVLGRRVEVRRRLSPSTFAHLAERQCDLLRLALRLTEPGGHVVYSTCSIDREENEEVVRAVLGEIGRCEMVRELRTLPEAGRCDGGYFAVVRRTSRASAPLPAPGAAG